MSVVTLEGIVEQGQIRLTSNVQLPEQTKVYIIVPGIHIEQTIHVHSPRLSYQGQAKDFVMEIIEPSSEVRTQ